jgi:hypothetical protein
MDWQPIDTAPKDGTTVLLYGPGDENNAASMSTGAWAPYGDSWADEQGNPCAAGEGTIQVTGCWFAGGGWYQPNEVTHWMPLPEAPRAKL